jgi:hypothetical protein
MFDTWHLLVTPTWYEIWDLQWKLGGSRSLADTCRLLTVNLLKSEAVNDDPEVIQEGKWHHHGPVVAEASSWVKHERPVGRSGPQARIVAISTLLISVAAVTRWGAVLISRSRPCSTAEGFHTANSHFLHIPSTSSETRTRRFQNSNFKCSVLSNNMKIWNL